MHRISLLKIKWCTGLFKGHSFITYWTLRLKQRNSKTKLFMEINVCRKFVRPHASNGLGGAVETHFEKKLCTFSKIFNCVVVGTKSKNFNFITKCVIFQSVLYQGCQQCNWMQFLCNFLRFSPYFLFSWSIFCWIKCQNKGGGRKNSLS